MSLFNFKTYKMQYHPKLKKAMAAIQAILTEHDIAAVVVLHTPGFCEFMLHVSPSYSCARFDGNELRVRAKLKEDYQGDKQRWTLDVTNTANMLEGMANMTAPMAVQLFRMADIVNKKVNAEHSGGGFSSNQEQNN
jgi:hypothetical protein